jgi:hypothetical protein
VLFIYWFELEHSFYCGRLDNKSVFCSKLLQTSLVLSVLFWKTPTSNLVHFLKIYWTLQFQQVTFIFQSQFEKGYCGISSIIVVVTVNLMIYSTLHWYWEGFSNRTKNGLFCNWLLLFDYYLFFMYQHYNLFYFIH